MLRASQPKREISIYEGRIGRFYDYLRKLEHSIDQECKPGAMFPFDAQAPSWSFKLIAYVASAFTLPFAAAYMHNKG
ncbi:hypothetical protein Ciccas_007592 [Cichlidogyrus casuarinus]|uniref:Uncharacterized protein n=1 Tax=Cichlidogyrus casuarinus TaxID=1844966 RepID=A0ABD2Q6H8_9PLAT